MTEMGINAKLIYGTSIYVKGISPVKELNSIYYDIGLKDEVKRMLDVDIEMKEEIDGCLFLYRENMENLKLMKLFEVKANISLISHDILKYILLTELLKRNDVVSNFQIKISDRLTINKIVNNNSFSRLEGRPFKNVNYVILGQKPIEGKPDLFKFSFIDNEIMREFNNRLIIEDKYRDSFLKLFDFAVREKKEITESLIDGNIVELFLHLQGRRHRFFENLNYFLNKEHFGNRIIRVFSEKI
jgi:hypothetical protein